MFKEILDDIVRKLKQAVAKLAGKERAEAKQTLTEVEQLRDLFENALKAATEKAANVPGRAAKSDGTMSYYLKEDTKNGQDKGTQGGGGENRQAGGDGVLLAVRMLNGGTRPVHGRTERGLIVPKPGSVDANEAAILVNEYGLPVFVVRDSVFDQNHTTPKTSWKKQTKFSLTPSTQTRLCGTCPKTCPRLRWRSDFSIPNHRKEDRIWQRDTVLSAGSPWSI